MIWRCSNCGKKLGETVSTGKIKLKPARGRSYIVGYPVVTSCPNCRELIEVGSEEDVYAGSLPSTDAEMRDSAEGDGEARDLQKISEAPSDADLWKDNPKILIRDESTEGFKKCLGNEDALTEAINAFSPAPDDAE